MPTRLLIGPWVDTTVGEVLPAGGVPAIDQIALHWLDNYLKHRGPNGCKPLPVANLIRG